jgi:hypothetical protein
MPPLTITIKENLQLKNVPPELMETLVEKLQFPNPKWLENDRMGRWNRGTPRVLKFYDKVGRTGLWIPRGYIRHLINLCLICAAGRTFISVSMISGAGSNR